MSIEGIVLEHFSAVPQTNLNSTTPSRKHHAAFYSFYYDDIKQNAATTTEHSKHLISFIKEKNDLQHH